MISADPHPGHTPDTSLFRWHHGECRLLFSDSIGEQNGEWKAAPLDEWHRETYLASLSLLVDLDFDILVPWGNEEGHPYS